MDTKYQFMHILGEEGSRRCNDSTLLVCTDVGAECSAEVCCSKFCPLTEARVILAAAADTRSSWKGRPCSKHESHQFCKVTALHLTVTLLHALHRSIAHKHSFWFIDLHCYYWEAPLVVVVTEKHRQANGIICSSGELAALYQKAIAHLL